MDVLKMEIASKTVKINVEEIAKGVYQAHTNNRTTFIALSFGMLDYKIMVFTEQRLLEAIRAQFDEEMNELFKDRIKDFTRLCMRVISRKVHSYSTMTV